MGTKEIVQGLGRLASLRPALPPAAARWVSALRRASRAAPSDLVALEGSEAGLRLTRVLRVRGAAPIVHGAYRPLPADLDQASREIAERRALESMVAELGAGGRPAVAALTGPDVVVRRLAMPAMNPSDLRSALELECRRHVNYPIADAEIRFEIVGASAPAREISVLVAIAPKRRVEERRALLASAGLHPWAITVPAAGVRADLERTGALRGDAVVAYLEIGDDSSQIVVLKGRDIRFSRDLAFGRQTMAAALRQIVVPGVGTVERTPEAAVELLLACGIPLGAEEADFVDGVPLAAVGIMLRPSLERLVRELWNSFDYCNEQFLGEAVTRVVLRGPGASLRNLEGYLRGVLKMPVGAADLSTGTAGPERAPGAARSSHAGAAVQGSSAVGLASVSHDTLNFLSGAAGGAGLAWIVDAVPAPAVAAAAALLIVSIAAPAEIRTLEARHRVAALTGDLEKLASQRAAVSAFRAAREDEARLRALEARLTGSQVVWSGVLRELSRRVGPDVRLTAIEVVDPPAPGAGAAPAAAEPRSLRLSGLLRTNDAPAEEVLAGLLRSLGSSPVFDQARLDGSQRVGPELFSFTLTARFVEGAESR